MNEREKIIYEELKLKDPTLAELFLNFISMYELTLNRLVKILVKDDNDK